MLNPLLVQRGVDLLQFPLGSSLRSLDAALLSEHKEQAGYCRIGRARLLVFCNDFNSRSRLI